jgi:hypothetical protein
LVNIYPSCGCTGRTDMSLVQQGPATTPITPTPTSTRTTPTPTPTRTLTPTPTRTPTATPLPQFPCSCYEIVITSPGGEGPAGGISYENCVTGAPQGDNFLFPGTYYQCGVTGSMTITIGTGTITEISSYCTDGCPPTSVTPTPTPTVTSTEGLTPTPTPTNTLTPSVTSTIGLTPSVTPTNTQTPTPSQTQGTTPTPTVTPTITNTPSTTGSGCYQIYLYPNNTSACAHSGSLVLYETDSPITPTRLWLSGECGITPVSGGNLWFSQGAAANSYQVDNGGFIISTTLCP